MSTWSKFSGKNLSCRNCHTTLRMAAKPTLITIIGVLLISIGSISVFGFSLTAAAIVLGCLSAFALLSIIIPLELRND